MLPVTAAIFAGITNLLLLVFARQYIGNDVIGMAVDIYAYLSVPMCVYGLVGIITVSSSIQWMKTPNVEQDEQDNPRFVAVFAKYLFLDAAVWALCRFLVAQFFFVTLIDDDVCGRYNPRWSSDNFHHDIVSSVQRFRDEHIGQHSVQKKHCQAKVGAFQVVVVFLLTAITAAHGSMAIAIRRHAQELEKQRCAGDIALKAETMSIIASDKKLGVVSGCDLV